MRLLLPLLLIALPVAAADSLNTSALRIENLTLTNPGGGTHDLLGPTDLRWLPDGRMVITEKAGAVKLRATDGTVTVAYQFCVSTNSEQGLLGVEVDPDFNTTHRLFFYYSNCGTDGGTELDRHRVVSITLQSNGTLDPTTEKILVHNLRGPANHDGGALAIGPDGKLYIGVGDTGCNVGCCPAANMFASCLSNANGKILRVNLDGTIPSDNPLVGVASVPACGTGLNSDMANGCKKPIDVSSTAAPRTEIWAWGTRNPFRFTFDKMTGKLWVGDVGEGAREEIDIVTGGHHYGYPWFEGFMGSGTYDAGQCDNVTPGHGQCQFPIWDCQHGDQGCQSITGGEFVDSVLFPPQYRGQYFFADNATGYFYVLHVNAARDNVGDAGAGMNPREVLGNFSAPNNVFPTAVRVGPDGFPYYVMINIMSTQTGVGRLARLVPSDWDGGFPDAGSGAGGGAGGGGGSTGGGSAATGGGSGASGGGSGATGGGSGATGGGSGATGGGAGGGTAAAGGGGGDSVTGGCHCGQAFGAEWLALAALMLRAMRRRSR